MINASGREREKACNSAVYFLDKEVSKTSIYACQLLSNVDELYVNSAREISLPVAFLARKAAAFSQHTADCKCQESIAFNSVCALPFGASALCNSVSALFLDSEGICAFCLLQDSVKVCHIIELMSEN